MKRLKFRLFVSIFLMIALMTQAQHTYYVDDLTGNDRHSGTSKQAPWQNLEKVNSILLEPGDSVLFRRGGEWAGNLVPQGSGTAGKRIVIGAYGHGPAPVIDARGQIFSGEKASYTIRFFNQEYLVIRDLKIKNHNPFEQPREFTTGGRKTFVNSPKMGIYLEGKDCGTLHDIHLINLEICDVNGDMSTKNNGGVFIEITWNDDESKRVVSNFDGLYTEGCYIHHVDRTGWSNMSVWWDRSLTSTWGEKLPDGTIHNWYPSQNLILRNNKFERAGANAMIVRVAQSPLVEHCLFTHNGWKGSGNASFPFNCDDALWQYNEACYTVFNTEADSWDHKRDVDAGGFDSDYRCKNTIIQYNYSHHNGFGGILICNNGSSKTGFNDGTLVRYNIFDQNEHHVIRCSGPTSNTKIYNNVIYSSQEQDSVMLVFHKSWGGFSDSTSYLNNIFYTAGRGNYLDLGKSRRNIFQANLFYGSIEEIPMKSQQLYEDPNFKSASPSLNNWKDLLRFIPHLESPVIDQGLPVEGSCDHDFLGRPINGKPDIGAFEVVN